MTTNRAVIASIALLAGAVALAPGPHRRPPESCTGSMVRITTGCSLDARSGIGS